MKICLASIHPRRLSGQIGFVLGSVKRLRDLRLRREIAGEAILAAGKLNPFLGEPLG